MLYLSAASGSNPDTIAAPTLSRPSGCASTGEVSDVEEGDTPALSGKKFRLVYYFILDVKYCYP
jgi:hypothetical protein